MRLPALALMSATLLMSGCATRLDAVRDFADETRKISVAFDPFLNRSVAQCRQQALDKVLYTSGAPLAGFDPQAALQSATAICQPIADQNATARAMSRALFDYARQLSTLAGEGLARIADDNDEALADKVGGFPGVTSKQAEAVGSLLKFITRGVIQRSQREAIAEALDHEEAVGALADALVTYAERVHGGYVRERLQLQSIYLDELRGETATPISSRLRMMELTQQTTQLQVQQQAAGRLRTAVTQMKSSLHDLRTHRDSLTDPARRQQVQALAKDVRDLHQALASAF